MNRRWLLRDDARASQRLLGALVAACAALFVVAAFALTTYLTAHLHDRALADEQRDLVAFAQSLVIPTIKDGTRITVQPPEARRLRGLMRLDDDIRTVIVWRRDARRLWASRGSTSRGLAAPVRREVLAALSSGRTVRGDVGERDLYSVVTPITRRGAIVGAVEIEADAGPVNDLVGEARLAIVSGVAGVFAFVLVGLVGVAIVVGRRLRQQGTELSASSHELVESYRELERSSLEAIETLNATVEAKDPYTAGHSQRVRRISLAIGRELSLPARRLGALAEAALFHDVGKIGVPDDILTKEGRLTAVEFEILQQHAPKGAEIVGKLSRLHDAVPAIRHHHERFDGCGYPDGLSGNDIPLEASIIGLADAWDAMTTDRPYRRGLPLRDAFEEIRRGRGTQFNPVVVDAFLGIAERRPVEVLPPGATMPPPLAAVG